ncbi:MAG: GTPase Era [Clostridia bacterium]|nr:GTPase Era [Clostridia bacterium]
MKCGTVAVVGRANAGKSTLINVLVGEKISIVSPKPQTTRDNVIGILNRQDYQVVFVDTPGVYASTTLLGSGMEKMGESVAKDVDLVLFVLDIHAGVNEKDLELLNRYIKKGYKIILALTKIDIMPKENIMESLVSFSNYTVEEIVPISARKGKNVKELINCILKNLPQGEKIYSDDVISDKSEKFMVGEIMREKILLKYDKEIPHGIAVVVNEFTQRETGVYYINLDIVCEKANHKAIIIGKGGKKLKEVVSFARADMEKFLGTRVFLETFVKVKEDWRNSKNLLTEFGYKKNI